MEKYFIDKAIICGVSFGVSLISDKNALFEVTVSSNFESGNDANDNHNNNIKNSYFNVFLLIVIGIIVFLGVIGVPVWIFMYKIKNDHLVQEMTADSFQDERLIN